MIYVLKIAFKDYINVLHPKQNKLYLRKTEK